MSIGQETHPARHYEKLGGSWNPGSGRMVKIPSIGILQINLRPSRSAHDLAIKTARDRGADIIIISEQDRGAHDAMWFQDKRGYAALYVCEDELYDAKELSTGNGYVGVTLGQLAMCNCYFSPNAQMPQTR